MTRSELLAELREAEEARIMYEPHEHLFTVWSIAIERIEDEIRSLDSDN